MTRRHTSIDGNVVQRNAKGFDRIPRQSHYFSAPKNHLHDTHYMLQDAMTTSVESPFRIIVVGGGIAGVAASHMLHKAGIDHVVLERRPIVATPEGGSLFIYPHGSRILEQLHCLNVVEKGTVPPGRWLVRLPDGEKLMNSGFFGYLKENHGYGILIFERPKFLQDLYDTLPDKSRVRTNCPVQDIRQDDDGVEVVLANGEIERGDLVLGCDGVYSLVRSVMWENANRQFPGMITAKEKTAIKANWYCLVFVTPGIPELGTTEVNVINGPKHSHMFTLTPHRGFFAVYFLLDEPCPWPKRGRRFTDQDMEELAASVADHPLTETVVFAEAWKRRLRASVVHLEEGVLDHWYHGRIALAGDSAHKVMPNMGLGGNSGIESVAVLTNHLRKMLVDNNWTKPSKSALEKALAGYQAERLERMRHIFSFSSNLSQGWSTPWYKFLALWVLPMLPDRSLVGEMSAIISSAPTLNFVEAGRFPSGRVPWNYEVKKTLVSKEGGGVKTSKLGGMGVLIALTAMIYLYRASSL
ncbi:uncharacterized protein F4822DRAFT_430479 [Hypoxylon trugodes]|uniref:uncharacterized protein n=1 Tax=Hypoxylon trugodes TaxID=326681 RepID=UPI00218E53FF|nr:uncharacterized protein F4822DRAFT_430479 [Hypoxylon trugodes]KAI1387733.1 hypothetical protein F4822DRAFT_430479 [Hypoxylon trugodes]